jgi:ribosomal protein L40E
VEQGEITMTDDQKEKKEPVICPHCEHENEPEATKCANCGRQLLQTIPVPDTGQLAELQIARGVPDAERMTLMADTLAFLIPGFSEPLHIERSDAMVLGRRVPNEPAPHVDLTMYNAYGMGVSRRHALIRCLDEGYTIEDLGSANSTWINENKLVAHKPWPLHSGDQIRLGHLVVFVYFKALMSIFLVDTGTSLERRRKLTPHFLANHVSPYLRALADVQMVVDAMLDRPTSEVVLHTISVSTSDGINVRLERAADAIKLVREIVIPWKRAQIEGASVIKKPEPQDATQDTGQLTPRAMTQETAQATTQEVPQAATHDTGQQAAPDAAQHAAQDTAQDVAQQTAQDVAQDVAQEAAQEAVQRKEQEIVKDAAFKTLIQQVIRRVAPRLSGEERAAYVRKLSVALPVLIASTLELTDTLSEPQK